MPNAPNEHDSGNKDKSVNNAASALRLNNNMKQLIMD